MKDRSSLVASLQQNRRLLNQMDLDLGRMSEDLSAELLNSPFSMADAKAVHDYVELFRQECVNNLYYMEVLTDSESYIDQDVREETLKHYQEILAEELKAVASGTNSLLLPVTNEDALHSFKHGFLPQLYYIPLQAASWSTDRAALDSAENKSWNAIEKIVSRITADVGETNTELMKSKAELVQAYIEQGFSAEEAEKMVESVSGKSKYLSEKKAQVQDISKELEARLDEARIKFAPYACRSA